MIAFQLAVTSVQAKKKCLCLPMFFLEEVSLVDFYLRNKLAKDMGVPFLFDILHFLLVGLYQASPSTRWLPESQDLTCQSTKEKENRALFYKLEETIIHGK